MTRMTDDQIAVRHGLLNEASSLRKIAHGLRDSLPSVAERVQGNAEALEHHADAFVEQASDNARLLKESAAKDATIRALGDFLVGLDHVGPKGCASSECGLCAALRLAGRLP